MRNFFNAIHTGFQQSIWDNLYGAVQAGQRFRALLKKYL